MSNSPFGSSAAVPEHTERASLEWIQESEVRCETAPHLESRRHPIGTLFVVTWRYSSGCPLLLKRGGERQPAGCHETGWSRNPELFANRDHPVCSRWSHPPPQEEGTPARNVI